MSWNGLPCQRVGGGSAAGKIRPPSDDVVVVVAALDLLESGDVADLQSPFDQLNHLGCGIGADDPAARQQHRGRVTSLPFMRVICDLLLPHRPYEFDAVTQSSVRGVSHASSISARSFSWERIA